MPENKKTKNITNDKYYNYIAKPLVFSNISNQYSNCYKTEWNSVHIFQHERPKHFPEGVPNRTTEKKLSSFLN